MLDAEEYRIFIPSYLTPKDKKDLLSQIKGFPSEVYTNFFLLSSFCGNILLQGDGVHDINIFSLPDTNSKKGNAIIISNTCDLSHENERLYGTQIVYAPIISLVKYEKLLLARGISETRINNHVQEIKKQIITPIFYLPEKAGCHFESIVFLDRLISVQNSEIVYKEFVEKKSFSLTNSSFYLLLTKISIHFSRFNDKINRTAHHFS